MLNWLPWKRRPSVHSPDPDERIEAQVRELARLGRRDLAEFAVAKVREIDSVLDVLTLQRVQRGTTTANPYDTRDEKIEQLVKAYNGTASWGCGLIKRLIDVRRAYQMPYGLTVQPADGIEDADEELEFIRAMLDANNLAEGAAQELVKQTEFEGQVLVQLAWDESARRVRLRRRLWRVVNYDVTAVDAENEDGPKRATFKKNGVVEETLEDDEFAFLALHSDGASFVGNPVVGDAIFHAENADKAYLAWRKFNNLFANLTPFFECEDRQTATKVRELIQSVSWKIGTAIAANAKMSLVGPGAEPGALIRQEIVANVQMIAGITGVEPQDMGFPDILSNRAVAEEMGEPAEIATQADITSWLGFFEGLFAKAIRLHNRVMFRQLREDVVVADIRPASARQWQRIKDVLLPMLQADALDVRTLLEMTPEVDADQVIERLEEQRGARRTDLLANLADDVRSIGQ